MPTAVHCCTTGNLRKLFAALKVKILINQQPVPFNIWYLTFLYNNNSCHVISHPATPFPFILRRIIVCSFKLAHSAIISASMKPHLLLLPRCLISSGIRFPTFFACLVLCYWLLPLSDQGRTLILTLPGVWVELLGPNLLILNCYNFSI